jgi:hypothetical protein
LSASLQRTRREELGGVWADTQVVHAVVVHAVVVHAVVVHAVVVHAVVVHAVVVHAVRVQCMPLLGLPWHPACVNFNPDVS